MVFRWGGEAAGVALAEFLEGDLPGYCPAVLPDNSREMLPQELAVRSIWGFLRDAPQLPTELPTHCGSDMS